MDELFNKLGFSAKEADIYLSLLEKGEQTAADLAEAARQKRTTAYMTLEGLIEKGIVESSDKRPVRTYTANDPGMLTKLLQQEQERHNQAVAALRAALPQLRARYSLSNDRPGVTHIAGEEGYKILLDDMIHSTTEVLVIASDDIPGGSKVLEELRDRLLRRKAAGVQTRALFHIDEFRDKHAREFEERGVELRFYGTDAFRGEVAIYEDNVAFTVYQPSLIVTVINSPAIVATMRIMFEGLWHNAKQPSELKDDC